MLRRLFVLPKRFKSTDIEKSVEKVKVEIKQAPNRETTWSKSQVKRSEAMTGPRFGQIDISAQPFAPAAIDLIAKQPIIKVNKNIAVCDGGGGALGHPKVFINLDNPNEPGTCGYCGLRFEYQHHHHH